MKEIIVSHPLVKHKLTMLRDVNTDSPKFRALVDELVYLLAFEATRDVETEQIEITTPIQKTMGTVLKSTPTPVIVPILRAGLGLLQGMSQVLPTAEIGFLGMRRDEDTLEIETYANRLPKSLVGRTVFLLDPMLATGGSTIAAINFLKELGAKTIVSVNLLAAPEGLKRVSEEFGDSIDLTVVVAGVDEKLNENGYIVPGLGDAGDRLYGVVD
ncbi:MAG: uracil phosphoribosyltransferase [Bifidobacteriaceae bacterium]|jgi:uracil phosphoribosyltransferase|nr:uracil phosphoribosyltransferase [Bifidobacteriaceae bacterium]